MNARFNDNTRSQSAMDRPATPLNQSALSVRNLWKVYGAAPRDFASADGPTLSREHLAKRGWVAAGRAATFEVARGEVFVIMGLSGSGKSTLLRCLPWLIEPTTGDLFFDQKDLRRIPDTELVELRRNRMGMVFQSFALLPNRTVLSNVEFPLEVQRRQKTMRRERAMQMIEMVGLSGFENRRPSELSGGQQQRVGIARSLALDPELWLLDEPFSALDPLIRRDLQGEVLRIQGELAKTIVFITHDLDEAIRMADRIAIMKDGEIVQIGTPQDLVLDPANDYVARFVESIAPAKVVQAERLLLHSGQVDAGAPTTDHDETVQQFAPLIVEGDTPFAVQRNGAIIGMLDRIASLRVLAGKVGRVDVPSTNDG